MTMMMNPNKSLRVWTIPQGLTPKRFHDVPDVSAATWFLIALIHHYKNEIWVGAEAYGLEYYENGGWSEWQDDEGNDIIHYMKQEIALVKAGKYGI